MSWFFSKNWRVTTLLIRRLYGPYLGPYRSMQQLYREVQRKMLKGFYSISPEWNDLWDRAGFERPE